MSCDDAIIKRATHHLVIGEPQEALKEIEAAYLEQKSDTLLRLKIVCTAKLEQEKEMLQAFVDYFPRHASDSQLAEEVVWALIKKGSHNRSAAVRFEAILAAYMQHSAKTVGLLLESLDDPHLGLQLFSLFCCRTFSDSVICEKILAKLKNSPKRVKLACIETLGEMRSKKALTTLRELLTEESDPETLSFLIQAVCKIVDAISFDDFTQCCQSKKASLRQLAPALYFKERREEFLPLLLSLINDESKEVQNLTLQAIGLCQMPISEETKKQLIEKMTGQDPHASILASFALLGTEGLSLQAQEKLSQWGSCDDAGVKLVANLAICHGGAHTEELALKRLQEEKDPIIIINLSAFLIQRRQSLELACHKMQEALLKAGRLSQNENGFFSYIGKTTLQHTDAIPRYPEAQDLAVRLKLYSMMVSCNVEVSIPLQSIFQENKVPLQIAACELLFNEKGEIALESIAELLSDPNDKVQCGAAIVLAALSQDETAAVKLQEHYEHAAVADQEEILFAIGVIGSKNSIPFCIKALDGCSPGLKLRAATALYLCLNH